MFRRGAVNKPKTEMGHSFGMQQLDKGKAEVTKITSGLLIHIDDDVLFDMAFPCCALKGARDTQVSSNGGSSLHFAPEIIQQYF